MRKHQSKGEQNNIRLLSLDDDLTMALTIQSYFRSSGYEVDVENDPYRAIERMRSSHYDILLLDFLMSPICGDKVVEEIRKFNRDIFIILLTGHKSMVPPVKTIRELNIQGYYEKSDNFSQLELLVESCVKSIMQLNTIREYRDSLEIANMRLTEANFQLQNHYNDMVGTVRLMVDARDIYTRGHSDRVSFLSEKISYAMGRSKEESTRIKTTGLFHDIGKIKVPDNVLLKNGGLTADERSIMQGHPAYAADIMSNVDMFVKMIPGVLQHHERYDGKGYPNRLTGKQICEDARIICVADAFDAMTSFRRYRENMSVEQARCEILLGRRTQFDPDIADVFIVMLDDFDEIKHDKHWVDSYVGCITDVNRA